MGNGGCPQKISLYFKVLLLYLLFLPFILIRQRNKPASNQRILIVRLDRFGDMVLTLPMLRSIRKKYPSAKISVFCSPQGKLLLDSQNAIKTEHFLDEIIVWREVWDMHGEPALGVSHFVALLRKAIFLRRQRFDTVVQPMTPGIWTLLGLMAGASRTIATVDENIILPKLLKKHIDVPCVIQKGKWKHRFELCAMCAAGVGIRNIPKIDLVTVEKRVTLSGLKSLFSKSIVLNVSAGDPVRQLPLDVTVSLIEKIQSTFFSYSVVLVGINNDSGYAAELYKKFPERVDNLVGKTSVDDLIYIFKNAPVLVTSDTGSMHLAAMTDIQIVAYFTAGSLRHFRPMTDNCTIIQHELGCSGCGDLCFTEEMPKPCMAVITADELFDAVSAVLESKKVAAQ